MVSQRWSSVRTMTKFDLVTVAPARAAFDRLAAGTTSSPVNRRAKAAGSRRCSRVEIKVNSPGSAIFGSFDDNRKVPEDLVLALFAVRGNFARAWAGLGRAMKAGAILA